MDQPQMRHRKRRFRLDESRAESLTPSAEAPPTSCVGSLRRDLIENWDKTKRGGVSGGRVQASGTCRPDLSPFPQGIPRVFLTRFLKGDDQCQWHTPERRADVSCLLSWQLPSQWARFGLAGRAFLVSGWNILFSTKLNLATLAGRESFKQVYDLQRGI
jgi:hypothetical protein